MKILYVIDRPNLFGSELHLLDIVQYQNKINTIKVVCFREGPLIELLNNNNIEVEIIYWYSWLFNKKAYKKFISILKEFKPDIVHAHQPKATFYSSMICYLKRKCNISTIHAIPIQSASNYSGLKKKIVYVFHLSVIYITNIFSKKSIYVSRQSAHQFSIKKDKTIVIYNWISPRFKPIPFNIRYQSNKKFLCISSLAESKGIKELIYFFHKIKGYIPSAELTIVGDSDNLKYKEELRRLIKKLKIDDSVHFAGYQSDPSRFYMQNDIFISLTKGETFGLVFIEAMFYGCPIICSSLQTLYEIIPANNLFVSGHIQDLDNSFKNFLNIHELKKNSYLNYVYAKENYDYIKQQDKISSLYYEVLSASY